MGGHHPETTMNSSNRASDKMKEGVSPFHCCDEYEYHQKKEEMLNGVEKIEESIEMAQEDGIYDERLEDMETVLNLAREVANGERSLQDGQAVQDIWEFGLGWSISDPEECPGYAPEIDTGKWDLKA